ncbi:MAG: phosphoribosylamine--glycine ligase [Chlorobiales bacterium]|nr:phosphoribosylamine--glycine ligase [Chlorobiales bacterium]
MKVLVVGSGAREHCIAWAIAHHPKIEKVYVAPGNGGIRDLGSVAENVSIKPTNVEALLEFVKSKKVDLTIVGPEQPLEVGLVNRFESEGMKIFGPTREAAQLETSKAFAKAFMSRHNIPTAAFQVFHSYNDAADYIESRMIYPQVIKASGLAAGKGVVVTHNKKEALQTLDECFEKRIFGAAADEVVIEDFMMGQEASIFAITDGTNYKLLVSAQDHKRIGDGDTGKNTGGMGAYAPAPLVTPDVLKKVEEKIIKPTLQGMVAEGYPYKGFLYVGLMIDKGEPRVVEFNARLGDPETQAVLPLLKTQLLDVLLAATSDKLSQVELEMHAKAATTVVMASAGYPDKYETGKVITGQCHYGDADDVMVFHAGTKLENDKLLTSGGRVLSVTAVADTLKESIAKAYDAVGQISFEGAYYRSDIGEKGLKQKH